MEAETGMMRHEPRIAWGPRKLKRPEGPPPKALGGARPCPRCWPPGLQAVREDILLLRVV